MARGFLFVGASLYDKVAKGIESAAIVGTIACTILSFVRPYIRTAQCFAAGTLVKTKDGDKKIEDIEVGDEVWSYNEETGESGWKPVVRLFRNVSLMKSTLHFDCMEEPIECTPEHPFYILNASRDTRLVEFDGRNSSDQKGQWVAAQDLQFGYKCLLSDGKTAIITGVLTEELDEPLKTYNFEVTAAHTYFVGESGILVHNACPRIEQTVPDGYQPTYENGKFDPNPKHGMVPRGKVSARISNAEYGQYALDNSFAAGSSRMAYNGKNFLVFRTHNPGIWHGYTTNYAGLIGRPDQIAIAWDIFRIRR